MTSNLADRDRPHPASQSDPTLWTAPDVLCRPSLTDSTELQLVWGHGADRRQFTTRSASLASYMVQLTEGVTATGVVEDLTNRLTVPAEDARLLVDRLIREGLLTTDVPVPPAPTKRLWSRLGWQDAAELHRATMGTTSSGVSDPRPDKPEPPAAPEIPLPPTAAELTSVELVEALRRRRTHRGFADMTISVQQLAEVLHWTFRAASNGPRRCHTTPSALSSSGDTTNLITVFTLLDPRQGPPDLLEHGWRFRYRPDRHTVEPIGDSGSTFEAISDLLWEQDFGVGAPAFLVFAVNWEEYMRRHPSPAGYRIAQLDLGAYMQTALMVATGLGLRTFITPALDDARIARVLGTEDAERVPSYLLAVGAPIA